MPRCIMFDLFRIPTELWRDIIALSCVDGGFTGRSLALTSRFFHSQSLCERYYSLAFVSLQHIEDFLVFLRSQPADCRPRIQHLYLSFLDEPVKPPLDFSWTYSKLTQHQQQEHNASTRQKRALWDERFGVAAAALFALAAPTLRTLCVVEDGVPRIPLVFPHNFPQLEELSWKGRFLAFEPPVLSASGTTRTPVTFPVLQRVHFIAAGADEVIASLSHAVSASLTHIRVSNVGFMDPYLPRALAAALGTPSGSRPLVQELARGDGLPQTTSPFSQHASLPHLRHVVIHGTPPAPGGWCGHYDREWAAITSQLELLVQKGDGRVVVLQRPWWKALNWPNRLREYWVERMQGGQGCWVWSEDEEIASELPDPDPFQDLGHRPRSLLSGVASHS
ncbi:hypothetical protein C8Q77DRAFT_1091611 [Trametes polyzona]|nr:hypothetical protein C8Q77DRAFT_1091611 [Trametes polyzona]